MAIKAEKVYIEVTADTKDAERNLDKVSGSTNTLFTSMKALAGPAAVGAVAVALISVGKEFSKLAADAEEVNSKFNVVFKEQADTVRNWANEYASAFGQSKTDTLAFLGTIQDTLVPLGFARDAASEMSTEIVALAGDLASFNNLPTADVVRDIQSAVVGNTETLRKYGVVASMAAINQEALNSGVWDGEGAITAQEKAQAILNLTLDGTSDAQGDLERTQDSTANTNKRLENSLADLGIAYGEMINQSLTPMKATLADIITQQAQLADEANRQRDVRALYADTLAEIELTGLATGSLAELTLKLAAAEERTARGKHQSRAEAEELVTVLKSQIERQQEVITQAEQYRQNIIKETEATEDNKESKEGFVLILDDEVISLAQNIESWETYGAMVQVTIADELEAEQALASFREQENLAELDRISAEAQARADALDLQKSVATGLYQSLGNVSDAYFANQLSRYDKDSEEYKKIQEQQFNVNKLRAIADIGVSTAVAATKALELGPIAGPIAAAAIVGLGLANAANVAGTQFNSGSSPATTAAGGLPSVEQPTSIASSSSSVSRSSGIGSQGGNMTIEFKPAAAKKFFQVAIDNQEIIIR